MKKFLFLIIASLVAFSCQEEVSEEQPFGTIRVRMTNVPVVEVVSRAINVDDFKVYIICNNIVYSEFLCKDLPETISVRQGEYTVMAENISEAESLNEPTPWGQLRYTGSDTKWVARQTETQFDIVCRVANSAVTVMYDASLNAFYNDYNVVLYTTEDRKLTYDPQTSLVAYFSPATLHYEFSGTFMDGSLRTFSNTVELQAATNTRLNFRISEPQGPFAKPEITVDTTCEELYKEIVIDPSQDL